MDKMIKHGLVPNVDHLITLDDRFERVRPKCSKRHRQKAKRGANATEHRHDKTLPTSSAVAWPLSWKNYPLNTRHDATTHSDFSTSWCLPRRGHPTRVFVGYSFGGRFGSGASNSRTATLLIGISVSRRSLLFGARLSHHECRGTCRSYRLGWPFLGRPCLRLPRSTPCPCESLFRSEGFDRCQLYP